jgi:protein-S-isoprenylcysteine O-methyltransferase Ste14
VTPVNSVISALWLIFLAYWLVAAVRAKRSVRQAGWWRGVFVRAALVCAIVFSFELPGVERAGEWLQSVTAIGANAIVVEAGIAICAIGIALAIWARTHLGKNWGVPMSLRQEHELVTSGPYSFMRHPIYTGILIAMFGSGLSEGPVSCALFFAFLIYFTYCAKMEEGTMAQQFPQVYPAYRKRTKTIVPFLL